MEPHDIRVLLVEDDEDDFIITRDLLAEVGAETFKLEWADSYKDAVEAIRSNNHDVFLVDYRLGWRSGIELIQEAKRLGARAPIILLTGQGNRDIDLEAMRAGASDYLVKGEIDANQLDRAIRYAIERKRSEEDLKRERDFVFTILDTVDALVMVVDPKGRIVQFNRACERTTGFDLEEMAGKPFWNLFVNQRDAESVQALFEDLRPAQFPNKYEKYWGTKDRRRRLVAWSNTALLNQSGGIEYVISTGIDITERKETGEVLRRQQDYLRKIVDANPNLIFEKDRKGRYTLANQAMAEFYGTTIEGIVGKTDADYHLAREEAERIGREDRRAFEMLQPVHTPEERRTHPHTGIVHHFQTVRVPLVAEDGEAYHLIGIAADITRQREAVAGVDRLGRAVDLAHDALLVADQAGQVVHLNKAFVQLIGFTPAELNEAGGVAVLHADRNAAFKLLEAVGGGRPWTGEAIIRSQAGRELPISIRADAVRGEDGELLGWVAAFVPSTGRVEEVLREHEERYRLLADTAPDMIVRLTPAGGYIEVSQACRELLQYEPDELVGRSLFDFVVQQDHKEARRMLREVSPNGAPLTTCFRSRRKDGQLIWLETDSQVVRDPVSNEIDEIIAVSRNITEQKEFEGRLRRCNEKLERATRELQDFAYVASHDLQEPLRKVEAFGERLVTKFGDTLGEQGRDYLVRMQGAAGRMRGLVDDLLVFSRVTTKARPFTSVDLRAVADEAALALRGFAAQHDGHIEVRELPSIEADPVQMRQLFQNLISNALKFHRDGVPPVVRLSGRIEPDPQGQGLSGPVCRLLIEDNGIGFEEKYRERIFLPFQRLHGRGEYEGTGMGLAICRKIVERHDGTIAARSVPGQGSTFIVTLPVHQAEQEHAPRPPAENGPEEA